jgi:hypothetical protein
MFAVRGRGIPRFDYRRDVTIVAIHFCLKPKVEAAGIEPAQDFNRVDGDGGDANRTHATSS